MKMKPEHYAELKEAINAVGGFLPSTTMRQRWDILWRAPILTGHLYAYLDDDNVDTALRQIAVDTVIEHINEANRLCKEIDAVQDHRPHELVLQYNSHIEWLEEHCPSIDLSDRVLMPAQW